MQRWLHIGCGAIYLDGWVNTDLATQYRSDVIARFGSGFPFRGVELIFAEHFVEHLELTDALAFFRGCRDALLPDGILRVSTPNLDWVWLTHYAPPDTLDTAESVQACLEINRAFHGWGHRFLYNWNSLRAALVDAGFASIRRCSYGVSEDARLANLEHHERSADHPKAEHVLVIEASGTAQPLDHFSERAAPYIRDVQFS
jgi:hypothetical protein